MSAVVARDVGKIAGGKRILSHVSFEVHERDIFGVLGPNASGKSTMLRIASTLLLPDEGSCEVFGMDVTKHERAVRRLIGFVSPELNYHDRFSAGEIVSFYKRIAKIDIERVREILKSCGVMNIWNRWWGILSFGERVTLNLAIALGRHPKLLILDEPTANLDAANRIVVSDVLGEERITSLVATHDMSFAKKIIDRCIVLNEGKVALSGDIDSMIKKLRFKTAIDAAFVPSVDDRVLDSLCHSYRRKPNGFDVTFYVERDEEKIELMKELVKMESLKGVTMSEPSVEDLIFWVKSKQRNNEECQDPSRKGGLAS